MARNIKKCPSCRDLLIFPRTDTPYCEECGWPDEDFEDVFKYPRLGDDLSKLQPGLEYYSDKGWIESGIISGHLDVDHLGFYRYKAN